MRVSGKTRLMIEKVCRVAALEIERGDCALQKLPSPSPPSATTLSLPYNVVLQTCRPPCSNIRIAASIERYLIPPHRDLLAWKLSPVVFRTVS